MWLERFRVEKWTIFVRFILRNIMGDDRSVREKPPIARRGWMGYFSNYRWFDTFFRRGRKGYRVDDCEETLSKEDDDFLPAWKQVFKGLLKGSSWRGYRPRVPLCMLWKLKKTPKRVSRRIITLFSLYW